MPALVSIQCNPSMIAFYKRLKDKGKNGKVICLCDYAETGSCSLWSLEIREKVRSKI
jgi:hypothetical protein